MSVLPRTYRVYSYSLHWALVVKRVFHVPQVNSPWNYCSPLPLVLPGLMDAPGAAHTYAPIHSISYRPELSIG